MKHIRPFFFGLFLLIATACASYNPESTVSVTPSPLRAEPAKISSATGTFFDINEVGFGPDGFVTLTNFTDQPASLSGLHLCQGTQCFALPSVEVAPRATVRVAVGNGARLEGVVATGATIGELRPSDGEITLSASANVKDPKAMLAYLQWGSTPHALTKLAVDAGLWIENGYAPTAKDATRLFRKDTGLWLFDTK